METKEYEMLRSEESELMGGKAENTVKSEFTVSFERKREGMDCYHYRVTHHSQTNHKGLYLWAEDLLPLTEYLEIGVSGETGRIGKIFNLSDINAFWTGKLWNRIRKKHDGEDNCDAMLDNISAVLEDGERFAETLRYAPPFSLLFAGVDMDLENPAERQSRMTGFAGIPFLPLIIRDEITETTEKGCRYEIKSEGKIDGKLFDRGKYLTFVRKLRDEPLAKGDTETRHTERYLLDGNLRMCTGMLLH
ncbi:MAG: hypothetical protein LBE91_13890, partial [Tannerella sp.]|nr:hypothetical protein [Tannerella sp.]